jgi:putative transposase
MPWSETRAVNERARFVLEASEGWTPVSELCRRFGISRRVGYKWLKRFQRGGLSALEDHSRARRVQAGATPPEVVSQILELRRAHPTWGPRKLLARMQQLKPEVRWPCASTIGEILRREGVSKPRRRRAGRSGAWAPSRTAADEPNRVWTADFRLGSGRLCYPLTVQDAHSRFLLGCRAQARQAPGRRSRGSSGNSGCLR